MLDPLTFRGQQLDQLGLITGVAGAEDLAKIGVRAGCAHEILLLVQ
jgi:hypothetical protein